MSDYQVTCIIPDGQDVDRRIDSIGGTAGGGWKLKLDDANQHIKSGTHRFWTVADGESVWIVVAVRHGKKYLKTTADGLEPNNLLALPTCA